MRYRIAIAATALLLGLTLGAAARGADFIRGDINGDGRVTLSDAAFIAEQLAAGPTFDSACASAADSNDDGKVELDDAFAILLWSFGHGPPPPDPFPDPGPDPNPDLLTCVSFATLPRVPDPDYGISWEHPDTVQRDQLGVDLFLKARTAAAIDGFSIAYWVDTMSLEVAGVDFAGTILSPSDRPALEGSTFFQWSLVPTILPEFSILTAGAVFFKESPLERLSFPATAGPLSGELLLRIEVNIRPEAPIDREPRKLLWPTADVDPGANEFSVEGKAHVPGEGGDIGILIIDGAEFMRGDSDGDHAFALGDTIHILGALFLGTAEPSCWKAADLNDDSQVDLSDAIFSLGCLFLGTPPPPAPSPPSGCAKDPTQDGLTCKESNCL